MTRVAVLGGGVAGLTAAHELAERGYVCLALDYPLLHTSEYKTDPYALKYDSATMKGIVNHRRGVDLLRSLPYVDAEAIGAIGHSLGGHNALFVAAFDERIRAVVTSCGFTAFAKYYGGNLKGWTSTRYMPRINDVYANSPAKVPFDFTDVFAAIAPRAIFVNAPTRDANFDVTGVDDVANAVKSHFPKGRLVIEHPEAEHDFPAPVRLRSYRFLDKNKLNRLPLLQSFYNLRTTCIAKLPNLATWSARRCTEMNTFRSRTRVLWSWIPAT